MRTVDHAAASDISTYVATLAKRAGVKYSRTADDDLAEIITRLSDDEVVTDETEDLIVALKRARIIDGHAMVDLLGRHLNEKSHV